MAAEGFGPCLHPCASAYHRPHDLPRHTGHIREANLFEIFLLVACDSLLALFALDRKSRTSQGMGSSVSCLSTPITNSSRFLESALGWKMMCFVHSAVDTQQAQFGGRQNIFGAIARQFRTHSINDWARHAMTYTIQEFKSTLRRSPCSSLKHS